MLEFEHGEHAEHATIEEQCCKRFSTKAFYMICIKKYVL